MKKPIVRVIKTVIPAQDATVTSPIGPLLGQYGANIKEFCQKFNDYTQKFDENINLMVNIIVYKDKTVNFEIINVVGSFLLFEEQYINEIEKEEEILNEVEEENVKGNKDELYSQITILDNFKDVLDNNGYKIFYFFDINSNLFFFTEFFLYFLSKKNFNDYYSQMSFFFDFFAAGRFLKLSLKKHIFKLKKTELKKNENINSFFQENAEFLNPTRFKKKKSFFLQAGEDEEKNENEEEINSINIKTNEDEGNTLLEKNMKYFDLEKLEEFKQQEEMKKKKKPKNVSRIVKMERYVETNHEFKEKKEISTEINTVSETENDNFFFFIPKTVNLSVIYKIVKFKRYFNNDFDEKTLFRIISSTILSMDIKIIDDIF